MNIFKFGKLSEEVKNEFEKYLNKYSKAVTSSELDEFMMAEIKKCLFMQ